MYGALPKSIFEFSGNMLTIEQQYMLSSCCIHKSHCRLEALRTLNLAENSLEFLELLLPLGAAELSCSGENAECINNLLISLEKGGLQMSENKLFNWRESGEQVFKLLKICRAHSFAKSYYILNILKNIVILHNISIFKFIILRKF